MANEVVAGLQLQINANTIAARQQVEALKQTVQQSSRQMKSDMMETRGAIKLMGEELGINLNRHLVSFLSKLPGAGVLANAFPVAAIVGLGVAFVEAGKKLYEFWEKTKSVAGDIGEQMKKLATSTQASNNELDLGNAKLAAQIAKIEHKPVNNLAIALAETRVEADKLAQSLGRDIEQLEKILKEKSIGLLGSLMTGQRGTEDTKNFLQTQLDAIQAVDELEQARLANAKSADEAQKIRDEERIHRLKVIQSAIDHTVGRYNDMNMWNDRRVMEADDTANLTMLGTFGHELQRMKNSASLMYDSTDLKDRLARDQGNQSAKEDADRQAKAAQEQLFNMTRPGKLNGELAKLQGHDEDGYAQAMEKTDGIIKELGEDLTRTGGAWKGFNDAQRQGSEIYDKMTAAIARNNDRIAAEFGLITKQEAAFREATAQLQSYRSQADAVRSEMAGVRGDSSLTDAQRATQLQQLQNKLAEMTGQMTIQQANVDALRASMDLRTSMGIMFNEWVQKANDTKAQFRDLWNQFADSMNDAMAKAITGQKANWASVFRALAESMTKDSLKQAEGKILPHIPIIGKWMSSAGSADKKVQTMNVQASTVNMNNGGGGGGGGLLGGSPGSASGGGGLLGGMFGSSSGADDASDDVAAGMAFGGPVLAGVPYNVGEMGTETFVPNTNGTIVPNHKIGGDAVYHIDARGASAAEVDQRVRAALTQVHGSAVQSAVAIQTERRRRAPSRR